MGNEDGAAARLFAGPGEIRALCRALDWSATPLGPVEQWPLSLRMAVRLCLDARFPMSVWAGDDLVLIYNEGYPPVLGADRHPWAFGRRAREVWASVWDEQVGPELAEVMAGRSTWHEDQRFVIPRNGRMEEAFFTYSFTPIQEADGRVVGALNVFTETTARLRLMSEREARYRALFEGASDSIVVSDPSNGSKVLTANPAASKLFGYSQEEFAGIARRELCDDTEAQLPSEAVAQDATPSAGRVTRFRRKDGTRFAGETRSTLISDARGLPLAVDIIRDVTDRERSQQALRKSEETLRERELRFRVLLENVSSAVALIDEAGRFTLFNQRFVELLGLPPDADVQNINSMDWSRWQVFDASGRLLSLEDHPVRRAARTGEALRNQLVGVRVPNGGELSWILVSAAPLRSEQGEIEAVICTYHDITELRTAQEALVEANERLKVADQRKNEFMAALSHELRNPLAPIRNSLYILARAVPGGDQARRAREIMERQVDQLARLVDDLLDITRITRNKIQLQRQRLELNELVRRTIDDHRSLFDKSSIAVHFHAATRPLEIDADWNRVAQIVGNLLQNAAKFTPRDGSVTITVGSDSEAPFALIRVADTGVGLAPDTLAQLFQPFMQVEHTLDRSKGGLGLGLALIRGLVELHGGTVGATSEGLGRGSEFTVRLPLAPGSTVPDVESSATPRSAVRRRVLIVEDNADAADTLRELIEFEDHDVAVAFNGPEAIAKACEFRPDVVLCDIGLPGMNGYDVARTLRSDDATRGALLVAVTGYASPDDLDRAAKAGFDRHLAKPPSLEKLHEILATPRRA